MSDTPETANPVRTDNRFNWTKISTAFGVGIFTYLGFIGLSSANTTENDETGETLPPDDSLARTRARTLGEKAVEVLSRDLGAHEEPWPHYPRKPYPNTNRGPVVDRIMLGVHKDGKDLIGKAWCARAVRYAYEKAAQEMGLPPPFQAIKSSLATVSTWAKIFKKYKIETPKPGALALLKNLSHSTIVARVNPDGSVVTIEGNHGDSIANVRRQTKDLLFYDIDAYVKNQNERVAGYILGTDVLIGATS